MSRFGSGVPIGRLSGISTLYSLLLNLGGSSFTSLMVMVTVDKVEVRGELSGEPFTISVA